MPPGEPGADVVLVASGGLGPQQHYGSGAYVHNLKLGPVPTPMSEGHPQNFLWGEKAAVARGIVAAMGRRGHVTYLPRRWSAVMAIVRALPEFEAALALGQDDAEVRMGLGASMAMRRRNDEAIGHFRAALAHEPDHGTARMNLAVALVNAGRLDEGIAEAPFYNPPADSPEIAYMHERRRALGGFEQAIGEQELSL